MYLTQVELENIKNKQTKKTDKNENFKMIMQMQSRFTYLSPPLLVQGRTEGLPSNECLDRRPE